MIRYYSYYSFGGYKDMALGTSADTARASYYSPFLGMMSSGLIADPTQRETLERLQRQKLIEIVTSDRSIPALVRFLGDRAGYKLIAGRAGDRGYIIVRDISGSEKDEMGRSIPFNLYFVADTYDEIAGLAEWLRLRAPELDSVLGPLFAYDVEFNCLGFDLGRMNSITGEALADKTCVDAMREFAIRPVAVAIVPSAEAYRALSKSIGDPRHGPVYSPNLEVLLPPDVAKQRTQGNNDSSVVGTIPGSDRAETHRNGTNVNKVIDLIRTLLMPTDDDIDDWTQIKDAIRRIMSRRKI